MNLPRRTTAPRHAVLYFDFRDPCSYLAAERIPRICLEQGVSLTLEPIDAASLDPQGVPPAVGSVTWDRLRELALARGIALRTPVRYPFDSAPLLRACLYVRDRSGQEAMAAMADRLWQEVWQEGADPSEFATAVRAGREAAVPEAALRAGADEPRIRDLLDRVTRRAAERSVRIVPAVQVEGELFAGPTGLVDAEMRLTGSIPRRRDTGAPPHPPPPEWIFGG